MQARDGVFAAVAMHAVRRLATDLFVHMHELSLRFHISRKTGGLTRVLERGRNAIETLSRLVMSTGAPTVIEMALVLGVFVYQFDWRYGAVLILTLAAYFAYTTFATNWRIAIRRQMNESDMDANQKAIDSLLNYETVKYFSAEAREAERYDKSMIHYENASTHSYISLAVLNAGQTVIYIVGVTTMMVMCVYGIRAGEQFDRRFRAHQRHDDPALAAAQFHGHVLSRGAAGDRRHRDDVRHSLAQPGDQGQARRNAARRSRRGASSSTTCGFIMNPSGRF